MLNRRNFMKTVAALGMGMVLPAGQSNNSHAAPSARKAGGAAGSFSPVPPDMVRPIDELASLMEIERCADLLDDLDCIEIVTNYIGLTQFSRAVGDTSFWRTYCPFCKQRTVPSLEAAAVPLEQWMG